jgi:hypothetical protein
LLRLFKLVFGSIPLFAENESVLQPHLATIVTSAMKYLSFSPSFPLGTFYLVTQNGKETDKDLYELCRTRLIDLISTSIFNTLHTVLKSN